MGKKFIALCNCLNKNPHNFVILHKTDAIEDVCIYCSHYVQWVDAKILNGERIMLRGNGNKEKPYCSNNKKKRDFEMGAHFANYTMYYPYEYEGFDYDGNYVTDFDKFHIDKEEECLN
jgi:hypothetical protein